MFRRETKGGTMDKIYYDQFTYISNPLQDRIEFTKKEVRKVNLRERPYLEVEVVEVKKKEYIPKTCVKCSG